MHKSKNFYEPLIDHVTSATILAMVIEGLHAIGTVRKIVGDTEPRKAMPGTIRGDFSHHSYEYVAIASTTVTDAVLGIISSFSTVYVSGAIGISSDSNTVLEQVSVNVSFTPRVNVAVTVTPVVLAVINLL